MRIALASDRIGFGTKMAIKMRLTDLEHIVTDFGPTTDEHFDCSDYGAKAAEAVSIKDVDRAILVGGSGIGMSIVANKYKGVRAALCHDGLSAELARRQTDSNVLCLSADILCDATLVQIVDRWLATSFEGGRHLRRIEKIAELEIQIENAEKLRAERGITIQQQDLTGRVYAAT